MSEDKKQKMSKKNKIVIAVVALSIVVGGVYFTSKYWGKYGDARDHMTQGQKDFYNKVNEEEKF